VSWTSRANQISLVDHFVPMVALGVPAVPKPEFPLGQEVTSNVGFIQFSPGKVIV